VSLYNPLMKILLPLVVGCLAAGIGMMQSRAADFEPGTFTFTNGNMSTARSLHTANLLGDGRVLVAGGVNALGQNIDSAELYDPVSGTFTLTTNSMSVARFGAGSTRLLDGRVLIVGGEDSTHTSIDSVEIYDPATNSFTQAHSLLTSRFDPTVTLLPNGFVLVVGGYGGLDGDAPLASAELYDPTENTFLYTNGEMTTARRNHTATMLNNGTILIAGGYNGDYVNAPEIYDPATGFFTATGNMSVERRYPTATLLPDGEVLLAGGYENGTTGVLASAERYNDGNGEDGSFSDTGSMLSARGRHTASLLSDGTVLIAGGYETTEPLASAELYDPITGAFSATDFMNEERWRHTETVLNDGTVLIVGGANAFGALSSAEIYVVPEPSIWALALAALAFLGGRRLLRRRRAEVRLG